MLPNGDNPTRFTDESSWSDSLTSTSSGERKKTCSPVPFCSCLSSQHPTPPRSHGHRSSGEGPFAATEVAQLPELGRSSHGRWRSRCRWSSIRGHLELARVQRFIHGPEVGSRRSTDGARFTPPHPELARPLEVDSQPPEVVLPPELARF